MKWKYNYYQVQTALSVEETTVEKAVVKEEIKQEKKSAEKLNYEEYCQMSLEEKEEAVGTVSMRSFENI